MTPVGRERTQFALVHFEPPPPLDHSGKVSTSDATKTVVTTSRTDFYLKIHEREQAVGSARRRPPRSPRSGLRLRGALKSYEHLGPELAYLYGRKGVGSNPAAVISSCCVSRLPYKAWVKAPLCNGAVQVIAS